MRRDADSRAIASGSLCRLRAASRSRPSVRLSSLAAVEARPDHAAAAADDRERQELPVHEEVVAKTVRDGVADLGDLVARVLPAARRSSASARGTPGWHLATTDSVHTAIRSRCLPAWVTSPIGGSLGLRYTRSASRKNAAVSRTDRLTTPLATRCSGIWRGLLVQRKPTARRLETDQARCRRPGFGSTRRRRWRGDRHDPGGDECAGARRGRARGVVGVPRVAHRPDPRMLGRRAEAELRHLRLAQRHQAGRQEHPREIAVGGHRAAASQASVPCIVGMPGDGDVVLDERRHAVEEAAVRARRVRTVARTVERLVREPVQRRVDRLGAGDRRLDQLGRRHRARADGVDQADGVMVAEGVVAEGVRSASSSDGTKSYRPAVRPDRPRTGRTG